MAKVIRNKFASLLMVSLVALAFLGSPGIGISLNGDCPGTSSCGSG